MTCVLGYNILKEGGLYNDTLVCSYAVTSSGFAGLHDDNYSVAAYTIPASGVSSIVLEFGEYVDVCNVKYFTSPINLSDMSVSYGTVSSSGNTVSTVSSGTFVYAEIGDHVGYLQITHSGTTDVDVFQLYVEGIEHEYIGFGGSSTSGIDHCFVENSPVGYQSSSPQEITIYNEWNRDLDVHVSVAPSTDGTDNYIYLSTTESGTFYGKNDYGPRQPSFVPITASGHSLDIDDLSVFYDDWRLHTYASAYVSNETGYLSFTAYWTASNGGYRAANLEHNETAHSFFVSEDEFSADQSFTISIDIRVVDATLDNLDTLDVSASPNKFMLGFTNSFPVLKYGVNVSDDDPNSFERVGRSLSAVWLGAMPGKGSDNHDLFAGGAALDDDFFSYHPFSDFSDMRGYSNSHPILSYVLLEHLSENVFEEDDYRDGSTSAPWRTLRVSYDHQTRTAYYYIDNVMLSTYQYSSSAFMEACKFFFGYFGFGSVTIDMRNLNIEKNKVYRKYCSQSYAAANRSKDLLGQPPSNMIDGKYEGTNHQYAWVSDDNPTTGDYFEVGFNESYTIDAVALRRPAAADLITISGTTYSTPRYALDRVFLYFNTGDIRYVDFESDDQTGMDGWDVSYMTTLSGTIEPVNGATSVSGIISTVHDSGVETRPDVLAIDEIQFYTVSGIEVPTQSTSVDWSYPWRNGLTRNLYHKGSSNIYEMLFTNVYDVTSKEVCRDVVRGVDYDVSDPVYSSNEEDYVMHYAETLFVRTGRDGGAHVEANVRGRQAWLWRYFEETVSLKAALFTFYASPATGDSYKSHVDKWKWQYLRQGGDPNVLSDWVDIPPITNVYSGGGDYATFTQYLVDHNDGEYYTEFLNSMDATSYIPVPSDLTISEDKYINLINFSPFTAPVCDVYVEFDTTYRTQGLRLVIDDGYTNSTRSVAASGYTLKYFVAFSDRAVGSYVSPVFDTGVRLNTERIHVRANDFEGDTTILYRAHSSAPMHKYDPAFENWEDLGCPFAGLDEAVGFDPFYDGVSGVYYDGYIYFFGSNSSKIILYNVGTRKWSYSDSLPTESDGEVIRPDLRTRNNTHILGNSIVCAAYSQGGSGVYSSSLLRYYITANSYGYDGWETFPYQRQPEAVNACCVSDGSERIFFLSVDGDITVFYNSTGVLDTEGRAPVPLHGSLSRNYYVPAYYNNKLYVAGGTYNSKYAFDIYDIATDTWTSGPNLPFSQYYSYAFYYGGYIYVFPYYPASKWAPFMKYSIANNSWAPVTSLGYNYATSFLEHLDDPQGNAPVSLAYVLAGDYIYGIDRLRNDFRRTKLKSEPWVEGSLPGKEDSEWSNSGGSPWFEVTVSGELMPQERYIQYKVILETPDNVIPPIIRNSTIVQPLKIGKVPTSGTGSIFLKTGISTERSFEVWYSGSDYDWDPSIIYCLSDDGYSFYNSTQALGDVTISGSIYHFGYFDGFVVKDQAGYEMWSTHAEEQEAECRWGSIHYATSSNGYNWSSSAMVVGTGYEGVYDTDHIYGACVIKEATVYKMWYTGVDSAGYNRIIYADSTDGVNWSNFTLSHDKATISLEPDADFNGALNPSVVLVNGVYHMWYEGYDQYYVSRIIYCSSTDGLNWSGHQIVLTKDEVVQLDVLGVGDPCVVHDLDMFYIWFTGYGSEFDMIYYGESTGGITWSNVFGIAANNFNGTYDTNAIRGFNVVITHELEPTNEFKQAKLKIYNGYPS